MEIVSKQGSRQSTTSLTASSHGYWPAAVKARERYGDESQFLRTFALENIQAYTSTQEKQLRCVVGTAPQLSVVANAYGVDVADSWLTALVARIYRATGQEQNAEQINLLAGVLMAEYSDLKVTDFMLFTSRLLAGHYGHFYRDTDITRIGAALTEYRKERMQTLSQYVRDETRRKAEEQCREIRENGIGLDDWLRIRNDGLTEPQKDFLSRFVAQTPADLQAIRNTETISEGEEDGRMRKA